MGSTFVKNCDRQEEAKSLTESEITSAMVRALKGGKRTVCFVEGSGEHGLEDSAPSGYSQLKDTLEKDNYLTKKVNLFEAEKIEIPSDCTVLVVGGPTKGYQPPVVDALKKYVEGGGRALFMVDPPLKFGRPVDDNEGLATMLTNWGVTPVKDMVLDAMGQMSGLGPEYALVVGYEQHPIVREMKQEATGFPIARSLEVKNGDHTTAEKLFSTTKRSFGMKNLSTPEIKRGADDPQGPLVIGAAGTYNSGKGDANGRFVVVGSSRWVANSFLSFNGNSDLLLNMMNWLSSDEDLISIRPKENADRRLKMTDSQVSMVFYYAVVALPLLVIVAGIGVWWRRR